MAANEADEAAEAGPSGAQPGDPEDATALGWGVPAWTFILLPPGLLILPRALKLKRLFGSKY